jgi:cobalt-zinc-cadmium efflux system outer membrane protein
MPTRRKIHGGLIVAFTGLLCLAVSARADSLESLVQEALERNPEIAAARKNWEAMKARIPQARALDDPMIGVDVERSDTTRFGTFSDNEWMIAQDIPWFGKRELRGRVEEGMARKAELEYRAKILEVTAMVKQAWYDLWQAQGEIRINEDNKALMQQFVTIATAKYEVGKSSQADVLKAQTTLSKLIEDRFDRDRELQRALAELNQQLRRPPEAPLDAEPQTPVPVFTFSLKELQHAALQNRPELRAFALGVIPSAEASVALAKKNYAPDFQFRVEARQFNGRSGIQEYDTGVFINFPWINRKKYNSAISEAKFNLERYSEDYEAMKLKTAAEVKKLHDGLRVMEHHYHLFIEKIIPQQRSAVAAARAGYEVDRGDFLDLLDAQRMLLEFEMQNLHHAAEFQRLLAELQRVVGGELPKPSDQEQQ